MTTKTTNTLFWVITILFCAFMLFSAYSEIADPDSSKKIITDLGFPLYINPFLGVLKILGVIALLAPAPRAIKEWAYAGFFFDLLGATYSAIAAVGSFQPAVAFMAVFFAVLFASYWLYRKRLGGAVQ